MSYELTNFPNGITSLGVPVLGGGGDVPFSSGNYYWIHSGTGLASNTGSYSKPTASCAQAIDKATANNGDVLICKPGHTETISGATILAMDKAGITLIGLGKGSLRPTLTFSATDSSIPFTAANCVMENFILVGAIDDIVVAISLDAASDGTTLRNIEIRDGASNLEFLEGITIATTCADVTLDGIVYHGLAGGMTDFVIAAGSADRFKMTNCYVRCDASSHIVNFTAAASVGIQFYGNHLINIDTAAGLGVAFHNSCNGRVDDNRIHNLKDTVEGVTGTGMAYAETYCSNALNVQGLLIPVADA